MIFIGLVKDKKTPTKEAVAKGTRMIEELKKARHKNLNLLLDAGTLHISGSF